MKLVFLGTSRFAVPSLQALLRSRHEVVAVVTQPDRPAGRGHAATAPPVKDAALPHGLRVLQPEKVSEPESVAALRLLAPDGFVVAAYGQILRQRLLDVPPLGTVNVHPSLLPRWRGASPIAAAILAGDAVTGVSLMQMVRALDAGPVLAQAEIAIDAKDTTGSLEARLAEIGAALLAENLDGWTEGRLKAEPQDDALVTYAPQINRADALLDWSLTAEELWRRVRAYNPWPVAHTLWRGSELRVLEAWPEPGDGSRRAGTVLAAAPLPPEAGDHEATFAVQTGEGALAILRLQAPGRRPVTGAEFLRGRRDFVGTRLGD